MTRLAAVARADDAGSIGPVAFSILLLLLILSPLMRGGNRHAALIVLEALALGFIAASAYRLPSSGIRLTLRTALLGVLCLSPALLALVYLVPLPSDLWSGMPGRAEYGALLSAAGMAPGESAPLSLVPAATRSSLLAGIPLVAALVAGLACSLRQLNVVCVTVVGMAVLQTLVGMLQMAGGHNSPLFMGSPSDRPLGTFANPNHLANYVAMGLTAFVWLAWWAQSSQAHTRALTPQDAMARRRRTVLWSAGAVLLVVGLLMSRSRGAILSGFVTALVSLFLVRVVRGGSFTWHKNLATGIAGLATAAALVGVDALMSRLSVGTMVADAPSRTIQAATTMEGAWHFWPVGSGWGTYGAVYPRFQPAALVGTADYAHQDYAQMLFEGGAFAAVLMVLVGWLLISRAVALVRAGLRRRRLRAEEMASAICGLGLLGFLLHSFVEFNMHIPANAILAAFLAGVYLRPLDSARTPEDT